jgi:hypothetical protein
MNTATEVLKTIAALPPAERDKLAKAFDSLAAASQNNGANTGVAAADLEKALTRLPGMNAKQRDAVVLACANAGLIIGDIKEISASAGHSRTPDQILAASSEHEPSLKRLKGQLARVGYDLKPNEPVDLFKLNDAIKASGDPSQGWYLKTAMAQIGLIK